MRCEVCGDVVELNFPPGGGIRCIRCDSQIRHVDIDGVDTLVGRSAPQPRVPAEMVQDLRECIVKIACWTPDAQRRASGHRLAARHYLLEARRLLIAALAELGRDPGTPDSMTGGACDVHGVPRCLTCARQGRTM